MKLEDVKRICGAATPGPWVNAPEGMVQRRGGEGPIILWDDDPKNKAADYGFIAMARTMLPKLVKVAVAAMKLVEAIDSRGPANDKQLRALRNGRAALAALESDDV